ncbi:hypothetical protein K1T71_006882 [Dendrolimus kikuchii]|uniref:Uncharacterized protein n=1 Tax=Dendrolimus kikuchii TaxID=765133 RepID=A0ACC1D227_9NEOP|nr:hypothetical protein K1T71_006882 [Dendrolimus kikuchii]
MRCCSLKLYFFNNNSEDSMARLDIVIFGATGFTGKAAVIELVKLIKKYPGMTWGVAGRSEKKLQDMMAEVSNKTGEDLSGIDVILADIKDEQSLKDMCNQAKVIANCCGPYRLYGEPVVKVAIECQTHYVDVSGEPQFIETMQLKYHKQAEEAGVYIISACGLDSIPNDMGVIFLEKNFGGILNSVESYISADIPDELKKEANKHGIIHYGTWESLVYSIANKDELGPLRKQLYPEPMPKFKPTLQKRSFIHKYNGKWCVPFGGADVSVVYRTQRYLYEVEHQRPAQFSAYIAIGSLCQTIGLILGFSVVSLMSKWECTRRLLLNHPKLFSAGMLSREGPTEEVMNATSFAVNLYGEGWAEGTDVEGAPNRKVEVKVSGKNPGYGATVVCLLLSAVTILKEKSNMPARGGVFTTGVAFKDTKLINQLIMNDVVFEIIQGSTKTS